MGLLERASGSPGLGRWFPGTARLVLWVPGLLLLVSLTVPHVGHCALTGGWGQVLDVSPVGWR